MTYTYNKLKLLQIVDGTILAALLAALVILIWTSLTGLSQQAHNNLERSTVSLQQAQSVFAQQAVLTTLIEKHNASFEALNADIHRFAFYQQDGIAPDLHKIQKQGQELKGHSYQLLKIWPDSIKPNLKSEYQTIIRNIVNITQELDEQNNQKSREHYKDMRTYWLQSRVIMAEIDASSGQFSNKLADIITRLISDTQQQSLQIEQRLTTIKHRTLWGIFGIVGVLLAIRLFFAIRIQKIIHTIRKAQREAEQALQAKARFLATMSHEIRTPLNGVIGMTHLLMKTPMSKKQTEFVESIHLSSDHLLTVINDVLDFSKIEAGRLQIKSDPLELRACIEDVLNLLNSKALEKDLELAYAVSPDIPLFIKGDMVRLRQVLTNLIGNAIKFTEQGEITILVSGHQQTDDNWELEFQIKDTGPGIPEERTESIFEQFSQADNSLSRSHEGTGLGLTISRHIVEMMQGRIWAESTLGVGSSFHFTLKTQVAEGTLKPFQKNNIPEIRGKRILIIENNPASSQAMSDFCDGWGAHAELATTIDEAIIWMDAGKHYDIALVDSNLPKSTPMEFGQYVRQRFNKQELPLILVAPPNDRHPKPTVRELFNLYLTKPITRSRLFDSLMTVLGEYEMVPAKPEPSSCLKLGERMPLSILLAEDNPINQVVASSILDEMSYKTDLAENGKEVLEALNNKAYDVIFMDMQMPEMDGLEATRRIRRELPIYRQPVIIAMTANAMEGDRQHCLDAGMNDYISKPILPGVVEAALERCCQEQINKTQEPIYEALSD